MPTTFLSVDIFQCPSCHAALNSPDPNARCATCQQSYPAREGIPSLMPSASLDVVEYDLDWHSSDKKESQGVVKKLKQIKKAVEGHPFFNATIGAFLNNGFYSATLRELNKRISRQELLLDIGVRTGDFAKNIRSRVVGIDIDVRSLKHLSQTTKVFPVHADATALPFRKNSFDAVFCTEVIEHIENDVGVIAEAARVLKESGTAIFTTPNGRVVPRTQEIGHIHLRHYQPEALRALLGNYFSDVDVRTRFVFTGLVKAEAAAYQKFLKNHSYPLLLYRACLCFLQMVLFHGVERFLPDRGNGYNLLAICRRPKH